MCDQKQVLEVESQIKTVDFLNVYVLSDLLITVYCGTSDNNERTNIKPMCVYSHIIKD